MSWWQARVAPGSSGQAVFQRRCSVVQGRRLVSGWMTVTTERLVFTPTRIDRWRGARPMEVSRDDVVRVWIQLPELHPVHPTGLVGAVLPEVGVEHPGGQLFITVSRPDELMAALHPIRS